MSSELILQARILTSQIRFLEKPLAAKQVERLYQGLKIKIKAVTPEDLVLKNHLTTTSANN